MRVKRFILSVALPLFLAAVILALGTLIPSELLEQQKERFGQKVSAVPVSDVRPYGDEYEEMRQNLLSSIRVLRDAHYGSELTGDRMSQISERCWESFYQFLDYWRELTGDWGYYFGGLERLTAVEENYLSSGAMDADFVLMLGFLDSKYGYYHTFCVDDATGTPMQMEIHCPIEEYFSPWVLWGSLLAAYQEQCGLVFGEAAVSMVVNGYTQGASDQGIMEDMALKAVYNEEYTSVRFSAVSNDLTFQLRMAVEAYSGDQWLVVVELTENISEDLSIWTDAVDN